MITSYKEQLDTAEWMIDEIVNRKTAAILLSSKAGNGKTFVLGHFLTKSLPSLREKLNEFSIAPACLILTKDNVVPQTKDVLFNEFKLPEEDIQILNYEFLRSGEGLLQYVKAEPITRRDIFGNEREVRIDYKWKPGCIPPLIIADEFQTIVNPAAIITQIIASYRMINDTHFIGLSATPCSRPYDLMIPFLNYNY